MGPGAGTEIKFLINMFCSQFGGCYDEDKLISTSISIVLYYRYCFRTVKSANIWAEPEPKLWSKSEPKINNFGSATRVLSVQLPVKNYLLPVFVLFEMFCCSC